MKTTRTEQLLVVLAIIGLAGCGNSVSESKPAQPPTTQAQFDIDQDTPDEAVSENKTPAEPSTEIMSADATPAVATVAEPLADVKLYEPVETDFHSAYEADTRNRDKQTLSEYVRWVKAFYHGEFLMTGWLRQSESIVKMCHQAEGRPTVITMLNDAGRKIASEWSKDGNVRRINNTDLQNWGAKLTKCASNPKESTECIKVALKDILAEVDQKLSTVK